jgi:tellurite resistance protein
MGAGTALSSFLGPAGLAAIAIGGLVTAFLLKRKAADEATDSIERQISALTSLAKAGNERARTLAVQELQAAEKELAKAKSAAFLEAINAGMTISKADDEVIRQTAEQENKVRKLREAYEELGLSEEQSVRERLGNRLKWEADHDKNRLEAYRDFLRKQLGEADRWADDYVRLLKEIQDVELKIRVRDFKLHPEIAQMAWGYAKAAELVKEEEALRKAAEKERKKAMREYQREQDQLARQAERALMRHQNALAGYVSQMSGVFISAFSGVEDRWQQMLENMIMSLLQSGLTSLIMGMIFPEVGAAGFFQRATGLQLQQGTPYVPRTGWYYMHQGEGVIPAQENITNMKTVTGGSTTQNIFVVTLDWNELTRERIAPYIERMASRRETKLLTG